MGYGRRIKKKKDLQWSDNISLKFIEKVSSNKNVYFVGSYRDNEIGDNHPLQLLLSGLKKSHIKVHSVLLGPPNVRDLNKICSETLRLTDESKTMDLSEFIYSKSNGNPLFFSEYFRMLHSKSLIRYSSESKSWEFDLEEIKEKANFLPGMGAWGG